jgi:hypothetical protein
MRPDEQHANRDLLPVELVCVELCPRIPAVISKIIAELELTSLGNVPKGSSGVPTVEGRAKYSKSVREAAVAAGGYPSSLKLFSGICSVLGQTEEEAKARRPGT